MLGEALAVCRRRQAGEGRVRRAAALSPSAQALFDHLAAPA
jgi:hypothetical protein